MAFNDYKLHHQARQCLGEWDRMLEGIRNKKVYLVLLSRDASERSQKVTVINVRFMEFLA